MRVYIPSSRRKPPPARRGQISEFSWASQSRLGHLIASIDRNKITPGAFVFVTLTYHLGIPTPQAAKLHLDTILKRFERHYGRLAVIWKMEPQKRGAPHFHLLILRESHHNIDDLVTWWAGNWNEIAGRDLPGDLSPLHLQWHLGTLGNGNRPCVEVVKDWDGVGRYAAKYLGKKCYARAGWDWPGRWWGIRRKEELPITIETTDVAEAVAVRCRRLAVKWLRRQPTAKFKVSKPRKPSFIRKLTPAEIEIFRFCEYSVTPYYRHRRRCQGGGKFFMREDTCRRILAWAEGAVKAT